MNQQKTEQGFTLIEMLVVVAIIGILSATLLNVLGPARDKAKDARIVQEIGQVRALASVFDDGDYDALESLPSPTVNNEDLRLLSDSITASGGELRIKKFGKPARGFIIYSPLNIQVGTEPLLETNYYCVDSTGKSVYTTQEPTREECK